MITDRVEHSIVKSSLLAQSKFNNGGGEISSLVKPDSLIEKRLAALDNLPTSNILSSSDPLQKLGGTLEEYKFQKESIMTGAEVERFAKQIKILVDEDGETPFLSGIKLRDEEQTMGEVAALIPDAVTNGRKINLKKGMIIEYVIDKGLNPDYKASRIYGEIERISLHQILVRNVTSIYSQKGFNSVSNKTGNFTVKTGEIDGNGHKHSDGTKKLSEVLVLGSSDFYPPNYLKLKGVSI